MKTILKLLFVGLVAGIVYKYTKENNINIREVLQQTISRVAEFIDEAGKTQETVEKSDDSGKTDFEQHNPYQEYYTSTTVKDTENEQKIPEEVNNAYEFPVKKRVFLNSRYEELDKYASQIPEGYSVDMDSLVAYLIQPASSDIEKARVIFTWIALNITYDDYGYNTGEYGDLSADGVFASHRAVCEGFGELFKVMGAKAGLQIEKVSGYAKGYGYNQGYSFPTTNHAWNAIRIDGNWRLFDATWGQGYGITENGRLKSVIDFNDFWFDTDPYAFIFTHLPENTEWQLIDNPISKNQFENMPYVNAAYFTLGFDGETCFNQVLSGLLSEFPKVYSVNASFEALSLPGNGIIEDGKAIRFSLRSPDAYDIAVINNGKWLHFQKQGDEFTLDFIPESGSLSVNAKLSESTVSYDGLISYKVR